MSERLNLTKLNIIQVGTKLFLEKGYSATSPKMICDELGISPGNLTYYYPTKEHLLAVLIEMLAKFQWETVQSYINDGETPITALCLELTAMAAICEESEIARDLYISAYTGAIPLSIIRQNDAERAKRVFAEFRSDWNEEDFAEAEILVSGIEYATLAVTEGSPALEARIAGAMNAILNVYGVPQERRLKKLKRALKLDYRRFGREMLEGFKGYVNEITEKNKINFALGKECEI